MPPTAALVEPVLALDPLVVYQFGSSVRGDAALRRDSDIDFAFVGERPCDPYEVFLVAQEIARRAGRDTDLVDLRRVGDVFKVQVLGGGKRVFTAEGRETAVAEFEMLALSGFARLNEEREEVLRRQLAP